MGGRLPECCPGRAAAETGAMKKPLIIDNLATGVRRLWAACSQFWGRGIGERLARQRGNFFGRRGGGVRAGLRWWW
jgi:hypothetical protein